MNIKPIQELDMCSQVALELLLIQAKALRPPEAVRMDGNQNYPRAPQNLNAHEGLSILHSMKKNCEVY